MSEPYLPESPPSSSNAIGVAGFVMSLVGIVTCGVLSPIGLILSLVGLGKEPKGLAVAGTIIGGVGIVVLVGLVVLVVVLIPKGQLAATELIVDRAVNAIETHAEKTGELPSLEKGRELLTDYADAWGKTLRYEPGSDEFTIRSRGPDGLFDTDDDIESAGIVPPAR